MTCSLLTSRFCFLPRFSLLFSLIVVVLLTSCATVPEKSQMALLSAPFSVKLIAINDLHGHLRGPSGSLTVGSEKLKAGGAQYLATKVREIKKAHPDALFVGAGDMIGASPILSSLFHDEPTIEALNNMQFDVTAVGNHEFDEGLMELLRIKRGGCHPEDGCKGEQPYKGAQFDMLAANVVYDESNGEDLEGRPVLPPYTVKYVKGVPIAFIGLTLEGTSGLVSPTNTKGLRFLKEVETINKYVKELKEQGIESIIVLIHEGGVQNGGDNNSCKDFSGPIVNIVNRLDPSVDLVISGHTHKSYICQINGIPVTSAKSYGQLLTEFDLVIDPKTRDIIKTKAVNQPILADGSLPSDPAIDSLIEKYEEIVRPMADRPVGKISADLTRETLPNGESLLGRVIADAQLDASRPEGAQIAMMNPGGIRGDILFKGEGDKKDGVVTYGECFNVQPFSNSLVTMTLTGEEIHTILEKQFELGRILLISKGFTYTYKANAPLGQRVPFSSMKLNGVPLKKNKGYRVVANSFLASGGDGFPTFAKGRKRIVGMLDVDALSSYFGKVKVRHPSTRNRITKK